mgnify:FL=1
MTVAYISLLERFTFKEVEVNSEYHAPRKYRFMVLFLLARDDDQLFQIFLGFWLWSSLLLINLISNMLHMNHLIFKKIICNFDLSRSPN